MKRQFSFPRAGALAIAALLSAQSALAGQTTSINPYTDLSSPDYTNSSTGGPGDNLGDHTATQDLDMKGYGIYNVDTPWRSDMAANKAYVDTTAATAANGAKDNLGNHIATQGLNMSNYNIYNLAPATSANQAVRKDYVDALQRTAGDKAVGYLEYNGLTRTSGAFDGGSWNPTAADRLNYGGYLYATRFYSGMYLYFSDARLKKDIETVAPDTGMDIVRKMRPVSYAWKQSGEKALGVIAQETEKVIPTAVKTNEDGIKAVDYNQIISPMLAAIQDLDKRVTALEAR